MTPIEQALGYDTPMVSVLCTAFQHEAYIARALDSFLEQQVDFPIEIIVNDDASSDGTGDIIKDYAENHPNVIKAIIQTESQFYSPGSVTKVVADHARGKYLAFCEGDDYWTDPLKIAKQVSQLEHDSTAAGSFHYTDQIFEDTGSVGSRFGDHNDRTEFGIEDTLTTLAIAHYSAFLCRREAFSIPDWYHTIQSGDMALFSVLAGHGRLLCIPEVMSIYNKHSEGVTTAHANDILNFHKARMRLLDHLDEHHQHKYHDVVEKSKRIHQHEINKILVAKRPKVERFLRNLIGKLVPKQTT